MKFHVTFGFKKKVIEVVYPHVIRSVITRSFNLPISNFNIQKWYDEWHDWVDVDPPELTDGDRLNLVMNPPELVMGLSPGASGVIGHSPATHCASPMVNTPIVTSNNFISNNSVVTNSSIMANSTMVINSSLMSGFEESVPASSNSLQDMVDTLMPDTEKHETASSTVPNHTKSDVRSKLVHSEHREFKPWPVPFRIPTHLFRPELKSTLASKQILSRKMKSALIQAIYDEMINYTVYPTSSQYKEVAMAIITEYSHLRDNIPGSKGYESWSATLSDKFRNERRIMTNIEVVEKRKRRRVVTEPESSSGDPSEKSAAVPSSYRQTQEGLESWTTSSGISSLIESLEGCSAAATTTSIAPSRTIASEELPSFSFTSVKSPTPFKKAYVESEHADGILKSLSWLWRTNKLCDAVICSGETKIMLHRLILFAVSPHLLEKNIRDGAELEVNLPSGINDEALGTFVAFLYDGVLNLTEYNYKDIERVGNLLRVEKVQRYCREFASSLAEYKLHQQLPMPVAPVIDGGNHEYVGKRKRGRPSKQTVVLNLGDEHSLGDRLDPSHYLQSGELSNYHNMSLSSSAISRMNSDMPVVFPDSQEYCLPSTSQTAQLFPSNQGNVKTEPYQQSQEFCSPFRINPKGSKSNSKEDADHISSFVMHETSGKSSTTMDIQTTTNNSNNNNGGDEDNNSTTANNNNDNGKNSTSSVTSEKNSNSKSNTKSLGSPSSKGDGGPSETLQSSPYSANVVASSGDGFSLYSLASS